MFHHVHLVHVHCAVFLHKNTSNAQFLWHWVIYWYTYFPENTPHAHFPKNNNVYTGQIILICYIYTGTYIKIEFQDVCWLVPFPWNVSVPFSMWVMRFCHTFSLSHLFFFFHLRWSIYKVIHVKSRIVWCHWPLSLTRHDFALCWRQNLQEHWSRFLENSLTLETDLKFTIITQVKPCSFPHLQIA